MKPISRIDFIDSENTFFMGRNGFFKCRGLDVSSVTPDVICFVPITSKGKQGRSTIEIPVSKIPELIKILQAIQEKREGLDHARIKNIFL